MRLKLLFPPHLAFVQPYLSLPVLTAFLRERGVEVSQEDLNISSFDYFMRPAYLAQCAERLERVLATFKGKRSLAPVDYERYWAICSTLLAAPLVIENILKAVGFLRTRKGFLDFEEYTLNERVVQEAFNLLSAVHHPTAISLASFAMQYSPEASGDIFAAIADATQNPYRSFLEAYVTGHLRREAPDVIGISLAAPSQVISGLTLAGLVRLKMPGTKIVVGGMIPSLLAEKIRDVPCLFTLFDYLIKFEGETPLLRLCQHLERECAVTQVPNLLYLDRGEVKDTGLNSFEDVNELPTPIYDGDEA